MVYHIFFWVFGAAASLQWDYLPGVPQGEEAMQRVPWNEKPIGKLVYHWFYQWEGKTSELSQALTVLKQKVHSKHPASDEEKCEPKVYGYPNGPEALETESAAVEPLDESVDPDIQLARRVSRLSATTPSHVSRVRSRQPQPEPPTDSKGSSEITLPLTRGQDGATVSPSRWKRMLPARLVKIMKPVSVIITPITISLAISIPVSVIQPLKALFTNATASGGPDWKGPDGNPPLNFIMETGELTTTNSIQ